MLGSAQAAHDLLESMYFGLGQWQRPSARLKVAPEAAPTHVQRSPELAKVVEASEQAAQVKSLFRYLGLAQWHFPSAAEKAAPEEAPTQRQMSPELV